MRTYKIKILLLLFFCSFFVSCAFAPLSSVKTARPQGKGKWRIDTGLSPCPYVNISGGMTEKLDVGFIVESQLEPLVSIWGTYNFLDGKEDGVSASAALGGFYGMAHDISTGYYFGPVISFRKNWFETYLFARYNKVFWKDEELEDDDDDNYIIESVSWEDTQMGYYQATLGINVWVIRSIALNINGACFLSDDDSDAGFAYGAAIIWDFY